MKFNDFIKLKVNKIIQKSPIFSIKSHYNVFDGEQNAIKLTMRRFSSINHRQVNTPLKISIKHCDIALIKPPLVPTTISFRNTRLKMENENRYERRHE